MRTQSTINMKSFFSQGILLLAVAMMALTGCRNEANLIPETCFDGIQNQGETGVDCGGPNCDECAPTCEDNMANQDEFSPVSLTNPNVRGIDCGGENCEPCSTCDDGIQNAHWVRDINLSPEDMGQDSVGMGPNGLMYRLVMEPGIDCGFPCDSVCAPTCEDGIINGLETGIDCGGPDCPPCPTPPNCFDGIQNGQETGVDCGSADCPLDQQDCPDPTCSDGIQNVHIELSDMVQEGYIVVIETGVDCDQNPITSCPTCPLPTCFDGVANGNEEGIDCGGNCITACAEIPSCHDGVQNGNEDGVDCGGDCPPCPTCSDLFKNGPELDVDCLDYPIPFYTQVDGSPCPLCPSCHDNILTEELFELDIDCGGPECEPCEQYLIASSIGQNPGAGQPFADQFTIIENSNNPEGIPVVPDALTIGPTTGGGFLGDAFRVLTGIQQNALANGLYQRKIEIYLPEPDALEVGESYDIDVFNTLLVDNQEPPVIRYSEGFLDGDFANTRVFGSVLPAVGNPVSRLTITYKEENLEGGLIRGNIQFVQMTEDEFLNPGQRFIGGIEFAIQYNPFE